LTKTSLKQDRAPPDNKDGDKPDTDREANEAVERSFKSHFKDLQGDGESDKAKAEKEKKDKEELPPIYVEQQKTDNAALEEAHKAAEKAKEEKAKEEKAKEEQR
jgi:hypothetical protein